MQVRQNKSDENFPMHSVNRINIYNRECDLK